jgi:hypothetical protein
MTREGVGHLQSDSPVVDRRTFIAGALAAGFANSALPSVAATEPGLNQPTQSEMPRWIEKLRFRPPLRAGFRRVFDPSRGEKEPWYINDHCFIRDDSGLWHLFGITATEPAKPSEEKLLLHATASDLSGPWAKHPPVMHMDPAAGETVVWAPYVIKHDNLYWMYYCGGGTSHTQYQIHLATSSDLFSWMRHHSNPIIVDGYDARDPMVLRDGVRWILYYCATEAPEGGNHVVAAATSADLIHWSDHRTVFRSPKTGTFGGPTESPFVVVRNNRYYLFVCTNDPYNDSAVYVSDSPFHWNPEDVLMRFGAHAAEVVEGGEGKWFLSSAGWGQGGLYIADLHWDDE